MTPPLQSVVVHPAGLSDASPLLMFAGALGVVGLLIVLAFVVAEFRERRKPRPDTTPEVDAEMTERTTTAKVEK